VVRATSPPRRSALESEIEAERIAVESLRHALVMEFVAARERLRQEKRLEVEVEDR
jgi:hypothetical protein